MIISVSASVGSLSPGLKKLAAGKFEDRAAVGKSAGQVFRESTGDIDSVLAGQNKS